MCDCRDYYHHIMADLPLVCSILAVIALVILYLVKPKFKKNILIVQNDDQDLPGGYNTITA